MLANVDGFSLITAQEGESEAQLIVTSGEDYLAAGSTALSLGEYGTAAYDYLIGVDVLSVAPLQELLLGAAVSF